jgi:hypothetical protein
LTFETTVAAGADGLQVILPLQGPSGALTQITRAGLTVPYTVLTIKGIAYSMFSVQTGSYQATYA